MIQAKLWRNIFYVGSSSTFTHSFFLTSPFFCCIFLVVFLVVFFSHIFSVFFFAFFLFCFGSFFSHTRRNILTTIDLQYSEIYLIGHLVVLFLFFFI